jgi:phage shock protein E
MTPTSTTRAAVAILLFVAANTLTAQTPASPNDTSHVPRIVVAELQPLHAAGTVVILDVRTAGAYRDGHIAGAVNVPLPEMESRADEILSFARARTIVTYCSCATEHTSAEAAAILMTHGATRVKALIGGYPEWVRAGGKISSGMNPI